jgi:predicted PurR-regulated permease PerM
MSGKDEMKPAAPAVSDVAHATLAVIFIVALAVASFWVLLPFLMSLLWASLIVIATWPAMQGLQARLGDRRGLAVTIMTLAILLEVLAPLTVAVFTIVDHAEGIVAKVQALAAAPLPAPPAWVERIPVAGGKLAVKWRETAALGPEERLALATPYTGRVLQWFADQAGSIGLTLMQFLLTTIVAAIMYANGETVRSGILGFARRLAGAEGEAAAVLAGKAARGVALGVVVTAIVQTALGGAGLFIAGVPGASLLTALMLMLCLAQIGVGPVLLPAVGWLYWKGSTGMGTVLLVFAVLALTVDNVLRPLLIKKGADLPLILIFAGVIGGLVAFGVVGLFVGPVVLAIASTLLRAWVSGGEEKGKAAPPPG